MEIKGEGLRIKKAEECDLYSYWETLSEVIRERIYLGTLMPFSWEQSSAFMKHGISRGYPYLVVVNAAEEVVGWCDVGPVEGREKTGYLGIGLRRDVRGRGLGRRLMLKALKEAEHFGFDQVELVVRSGNTRAIHLYESLGFHEIFRELGGFVMDGEPEDVIRMRILLEKWNRHFEKVE